MCQFANTRRRFLSAAVPAALLAARLRLNSSPLIAMQMAARFRTMSDDFERKGLAEPFKGITADGNIVPGLFPIQSTGVSTAAVRGAAESSSTP